MADATSLLTPEEMSDRLHGVLSPERLVELAQSQIAPHYTIDDQILFGCGETKEWINHNLVIRHPGKHLGDGILRVINVMSPASEVSPPVSLRGIAGLLIPLSICGVESVGCPGVYFLCHEGVVVYVGQAVNVLSRVGAHVGDKTFDSVFFARVPASDLDFVEGSLIRSLSPKYNKNNGPCAYGARPEAESAALVEAVGEDRVSQSKELA